MELTARVNRDEFIDQYITIWNGGLNLTDKEKEVLHKFLSRYLDMMANGLKEPYIGELVFAPKTVREIGVELGLTAQGINNYKAQLRGKGVILQVGDHYEIHPRLIPQTKLTFNFIVHD